MRSWVVGVVLGAALLSAAPASASTAARLPAVKAKHACNLLKTGEITARFTDAPLDPGPRRLPAGVRENYTGCAWDDQQTSGTTPQLIARVFLARDITKKQAAQLTTLVPGGTVRPLTAAELDGIGSEGAIDIWADGSYATVSGLKGHDYYIVSVGYVGTLPPKPITEAQILAVARAAAKRV